MSNPSWLLTVADLHQVNSRKPHSQHSVQAAPLRPPWNLHSPCHAPGLMSECLASIYIVLPWLFILTASCLFLKDSGASQFLWYTKWDSRNSWSLTVDAFDSRDSCFFLVSRQYPTNSWRNWSGSRRQRHARETKYMISDFWNTWGSSSKQLCGEFCGVLT